jgi:hypothetical protein
MDGWDGRICQSPASNTYCVGDHSYPGDQIKVGRRIDWELQNAGKPCATIDGIPPCVYSINAFGKEQITGYSDPPDWYPADERLTWDLPPSTVCIWPFEEMYRDEVNRFGGDQKYDYDKRLAFAQEYFAKIEPSRSMVFYYANYSNPFSEEDARRYVVVGMSRVKQIGKIRYYERMTDEARAKYGGGFVWALDLTSQYPDEGFRLPYHRYLGDPESVERFLVSPPNPRHFKYATRQFSDDDALELVERLIESLGALREMGDTSEDWAVRSDWLHSIVGELWTQRGLFPGVPAVLEHLGLQQAIGVFKAAVERGEEKTAKETLFEFVEGTVDSVPGLDLGADDVKAIRRRWKLLDDQERQLLREVIVRFELSRDQVERLIAPDRDRHSITASIADMLVNPFVISEQYVGDSTDDTISFARIDHGMLPSPELGGDSLADPDDWRRLRALCVDQLKREQADVFLPAAGVIHDVNHRLSFHPEWKRHQFTERYLEADRDELEGALVIRHENEAKWLYLRSAFEDERLVETVLRDLAARKTIALKTPMTKPQWADSLRDPGSPLVTRAADEYQRAIDGQVAVCSEIFPLPLCVLAGEAGTGKTTVVKSIIAAIEKTEGAGASFQLLAPTGKAAERLRERTGRRGETATIHSFLAKRGWLNDNMTFKRAGGVREDAIQTFVIDEASMLSLELTAALFRSINWNSVKRLILVGDPSQLPPIGRGRIFADVIDHLRELGGVGELEVNVRQMENRAAGLGTAILDLADVFVRRSPSAVNTDAVREAAAEDILRRVQDPGDSGEVDQDLRVLYWRGGDDLQRQLLEAFVADVAAATGGQLDAERPWEYFGPAFADNTRPEAFQVLTPYRGDEVGTEALNAAIQRLVQGREPGTMRELDGVALGDKVIQVTNRPPSRPIWAYCWPKRSAEQIEVYNGELGFARPHAFDAKSGKLKWAGFRPKKFQVVFSSKPDHSVGYGTGLGKTPSGKWMPAEPVEENLELAYAISVHKAQGSEFDRTYFVVPKHKRSLLSRELFYTGLTRAGRHCTLLIEEDISPLLSMRRLESSRLLRINASLFAFQPVPPELRRLGEWYEEGKIHSTLADYMVRSKSEVIIANILFDRDIAFTYEEPLFAPDGTFYLPDFTIMWRGEKWYWEHLGRLDDEGYRNHWETKKAWYDEHFPGRLITTEESGELSKQAQDRLVALMA